jgi:hypothetical protein
MWLCITRERERKRGGRKGEREVRFTTSSDGREARLIFNTPQMEKPVQRQSRLAAC